MTGGLLWIGALLQGAARAEPPEPLPDPSAARRAPYRLPAAKPAAVVWEEGRDPGVLVVKLAEGSGARREGGRWTAGLPELPPGVGARPWFRSPPPPRPGLADLGLYWRLEIPAGADQAGRAARIGTALLQRAQVEGAWFAPLPVAPPADLAPETEDFRPLQSWMEPLPGFGFTGAARWPGGDGVWVRVADLEYAWTPEHEDLEAAYGAETRGWDSQEYAFHGNSVLGQLIGGVNGYGVDGAVPEAEPVVLFPFTARDTYDVAGAVIGALDVLLAGDVLLIEQQSWMLGNYCPVSADPVVFDAITYAVAAGITVVEPGGNGGQDLDAPGWEGWFDRSLRDSGAILVGGGASPGSGWPVRDWYPYGSSYGSRVDVQGWYDGIVTASGGDYGGAYADLAWYNRDDRQAYTQSFGGTSGASPMVTAAAVMMQSVAMAAGQPPWEPVELRAALAAWGTPQGGERVRHIGPQPDMRRMLRGIY